MGLKIHHRLTLILALAALFAALPVSAARPRKEKADSLVRLMKAESIEQLVIAGQQYRKAISSTFLHNGTYLISDSAMWNVDTKIINAYGNVKVIQDETILTSDKLDYLIDENLARFRGTLVQLENKKRNLLRTQNLDYNTKDSIAVFRYGGAMRDQDGQLIESTDGTYNSNTKSFVFENQVNMFTDSMLVKTYMIVYDSQTDKATFPSFIDFWKDGNMLSGQRGWYDHGRETLFLNERVHGMSENQEFWSDTLYFYRTTGNVELMGHTQMQDSSRHVTAVADRLNYIDTLNTVVLRKNAAVAMETGKSSKKDTIYMGADTLIYRSIRRCDISEGTVNSCATRLADVLTDPVSEYRKKAAEAAAAAAAEASKTLGDLGQAAGPGRKGPKQPGGSEDREPGEEAASEPPQPGGEMAADQPQESADSLSSPAASRDSLFAPLTNALLAIDSLAASGAPADSLALSAGPEGLPTPADTSSSARPALSDSTVISDSTAVADSLAALVPDTTGVGFIYGRSNVRVFRKDIQMRCDYMCYCDLDSIARFYKDPVVWNEGKRQYSSDSLFLLVGSTGPRKASLQSNAFVVIREDAVSYDQIKGAEIMAFFDTLDSSLKRFDALGGASAIFYLYENDAFATVNKVESKMLSGLLKDGNLEQVYYFEQPKNNAYPVAQLTKEDQVMKGFAWRYDECPKSPEDISTISVKETERPFYKNKAKPVFKQAEQYFPGYMSKILKEIEQSQQRARERRKAREQADTATIADSLPDTLLAETVLPDTLENTLPERPEKDTLTVKPELPDTVAVTPPAADTTATVKPEEVDPLSVPTVDPKQKRKEERELRRQLRIAEQAARDAAREARWAELDRLDSLKLEAKKQKVLEKERAKKLKQLKAMLKQQEKDEAKLQKYIDKYRKKYEREQKREAARKRAQALREGRKVQPDPEPGQQAVGGDPVLREHGLVDDNPVLGGGSLSRPEGGSGL